MLSSYYLSSVHSCRCAAPSAPRPGSLGNASEMPRGPVSLPGSQGAPAALARREGTHRAGAFPVAWLLTPYRKITDKQEGGAACHTCLAALINLSYKERRGTDSDPDTAESGGRETKQQTPVCQGPALPGEQGHTACRAPQLPGAPVCCWESGRQAPTDGP